MKIIAGLIVLLFSFTFLFTETFAQGVNLPNDYGTIVYEFNGQYYVKDSQNIIISSYTPDDVIKTALLRGGGIYIAGGNYYLTNSFSGFDLKYESHLKMAPDANIVVPSGYTGSVFRFGNGVGQCIMDGGHIYEAQPVKRNWIGIMMQGGQKGVYFNYIENTVITNPYIVIDFNATTGQWINANTFVDIQATNFVRGIEFDFKGGHTDGIDGFVGNTFRDSQFQSGPMTTYGVKDVRHSFTAFYNVQVWDLPVGAMSATIDSSARNTIIIGGQMTYQGFVDNGANTIILDAWHNNILYNSTLTSAIINGTYQPKAEMSAQSSHQVLNMSIIQQAANDFVKGSHGQLVISPGQPTVLNIYGRVDHPTGGSVRLDIARPDGVVEQDQADVTSAGDFYYPFSFDQNALTGQYRIDGSYQNSNLGSLFLNVTSYQVLSNEASQANIGMTSPSESNTTLSRQIKIDAEMWSGGKISDEVFLMDIQYLVKNGIIENSNQNQTVLNQANRIPGWFKNNADLWANGQISDNDFFSGMQYLLNMGIIMMPVE